MESMNFNVTQTIMDPQERIKRFGIECTGPVGDGILFKAGTWRPGGEYIQKLVVRNVSTQVKKLKYKLPATRYFFLGYPEVITLSPGMFRVIDVVFRPVEHEPYDDTIYFRLQDGIEGNGFHVPVRATIDKLVLHAPDGLDLGYCTTNQTTELVFRLENIGEIDAPYRWEVPYPFMFTPSEGIIGMGSHQDIVISIIPEEASVYVSQATCYVGEGVHAIIPEPTITIKISAIGKYAYIVLSDDLVSFEEVVSGVKPETKEIILKNDSVVPAEFDLIRLDNDRDEVFLINPKSGVIPPLSEVNVTIDYLPLAMGCFSYDRYVFRTPGNCETMLSVKGTTMPPKVLLFKDSALAKYSKDNDHSFTLNRSTSLDASLLENEGAPDFSLNFRDVEIGKVETRILLLKNETNRDAAFSIIADEHGMFQMHPRQGVIPAMYKAFAVTVKFAPTKPINYYRRFFVLIGDALPLFYDCLGTGYIRAKGEIKEQRPAPIRHAHIQAYRNRSMRGLGVLSPDELDEMYANGENRIFFAEVGRMGTRSLSVATIARPVTRTGEAVRPLVAPAHEFFVSSRDKSAREIVISKTELDFDYSPIMQLSNAQTVIITNTTHSKVVVEWQIPIAKGMSLDNNKHSSKDPKDRAMINDGSEERKLKLIQAFEVHPLTAEIDPEKSYTFEVFFHPKQSSRNFVSELEAYVYFKNQRTFRLVNDHSLTPPWCLSLNCIGHTFNSGQLLAKAKITGTNVSGGKLVFPCCFVGESIYQTFTLRNTSDLPSTFRIETGWDSFGATASSADDSFTVKPTSGEVDADDFTLICVKFTPKSVKKSLQLLRCIINGSEGGKLLLEGSSAVPYVILPDLNPNKYTPIEHVLGLKKVMPTNIPTGTQGTFFMKPTCVGLSSRRNLSLKNATRLPLRYVVAVVEGDEHILNLTPKKGILKGNELADIDISFVPKASVMYNFKINVMIYPLGGKGIRVIDANQPGPVKAPELLQTLTVDVVCPGEVGAIIFDPPHLTVDVRLVNSSESKDIYIENVSDSDVKYQLFYKEEFVADLAGGATGKRVVSNVMPLTPAHAYTVESLIDDNHSIAESKKLYEHCLNCELPSGILGARSRQRVIFTYHPRKAGLFEFLIFAKIQAIDEETGKPKMISNDEAALLRLSQQDREDQAFHDLDQLTEELARLPLTTSISARAAYPKLLIEDIRTIGDLLISNIDNLWKRMALSYINYDLSVPMTPEEIKLNNMPSPDLEKIPKYKFEFAAGVINTPTQTIVLQLRNNGYLTTSYSMSLPNEKTLELETWCDEEEPSAEHNRLVSIIEELKVFSIEPKQATLDPGESCQLTITYNHSSLKYDGVHNLPVLVKLTQGKQFYIDLIGYTLPSPSSVGRRKGSAVAFNTSQSGNIQPMPTNQSALQNSVVSAPGTAIPSNLPDIYLVICTDKDNCYWLKPVPIGLNVALAPRQRIELINLCGHDINYEIEFDSIHKLIDQNFQMPIVTIANPVGTVPAHNSIFLEWYVYSLQATVYELPLVIKYSSATPVYLDRLSSGMNNPRSSAASKRGPRNSSANSLSSGRSSRSQNLQAQIPAPPVFRYLNAIVKFEGYDPRGTKPLPYGATFAGGLAPTRPILKLPTQQVTLVEDLLDFNVVPQLCSTRRLLILQNHSPSSAYEFVVNISTCVLYQENILEIRPPYGKIEASSSFVIDVILKANAQPFIFNELVKIMVREIVRNAPSRKGGMRQSLLDKIKKKVTFYTLLIIHF